MSSRSDPLQLPPASSGYQSRPPSSRPRLEIEEHQRFDRTLLERAEELLPSSFAAVDLGCGNGEVGVNRLGAVGVRKLTGIDSNPEYIKRARQQFPAQQFELIDAETEAFRKFLRSQVEPLLIFSAMTFHHFSDPVRVLRTIIDFAPAGSVLVIRTLDDGSKIDFSPSGASRLAEILELSQRAPNNADRFHGRKLYQQLFRAGFREISLFSHPIITNNLSRNQRRAVFRACFAHRADSWRWQEKPNPKESADMARMVEALSEYEYDIEDPNYFMLDVLFAAVARIDGS